MGADEQARLAARRVEEKRRQLERAEQQLHAWSAGAEGERLVAAELDRLAVHGWRALHDVHWPGRPRANLDHVLIGPGGVLTVNAKNHPNTNIWVGGDTFMVNGQRVPYIRNSRHEARRAGRLLTEQVGFPVTVLGVIAVIGAHKGFKIKKQPEDGEVVIVQRRRISQYVQQLPNRLNAREIDAIYDVARRSTTWRQREEG
jgi:hypothetical protein